jgi:hypothetical protein
VASTTRRRSLIVLSAVLVLVTAACARDLDISLSPGSTVTTTTTTTAPPVLWPLTGVPAGGDAEVQQSAVVAKIDNSADARPHAALTRADMVYEVWVEGITRFGAVFHSDVPDRVGPVRSARSTDVDLVANLGTPLLVWSGGNPGVMGEINDADANGLLVNAGYDVASQYYWRVGERYAPHNLFADLVAVRANLGLDGSKYPAPIYTFRTTGAPLGVPVAGLVISFGPGAVVEYVWDAEAGCARRFQDGRPFLDEDGAGVCPRNVVVQFTPYGPSSADARSPQAYTVGSGAGVVFSAGLLAQVNWNRPGPLDGPNLTDVSGVPAELTPGSTWVALPPSDQSAVPMDPTRAALLLGG